MAAARRQCGIFRTGMWIWGRGRLCIGTRRTERFRWFHCVLRWFPFSGNTWRYARENRRSICSVISMGKCFLKMPCVLPLPTIIALAGWRRQAFTCFVIHLPVNIWLTVAGMRLCFKSCWGILPLPWPNTIMPFMMRTFQRTLTAFLPWRNYSKPKASSGEHDRASFIIFEHL